ncbi:MAG: PspC domain-containing protein [Candidatus Iainarchaeum sp.]|jgi:phage shock protein C|nr:MAG: DNA-binding transcriptional activator PspC [archaeon ADurb.Bin336]
MAGKKVKKGSGAKKVVKKSAKKTQEKKPKQVSKKLYRNKNNQIISGVLAGIADYLNYDPTIIRLVFILLTLVTGILPGILLYILAVILIPKKVF